ncbi:MAG: sugar phosphate isomerase/epimerase [Euryarchaeota archaeon]|nr:sugar phosphate isomerase/epimerase [Euryarchaeota archaeon]
MNRIGQSSPAFCHLPIAAVADRISKAKFQVWEIFGEGGHFLPDHEAEFAKVLPSHSFEAQLHAPISDNNIGSLNPRARDLALRTHEDTMGAAARLGIERVTIHPGNHSPLSRGHYGKLHELTRQSLRRLDAVALELGVELFLENMALGWAFETVSMDQLLDLTQATEIGTCLDVGHAHISKRLPEFLGFASRFGNVHLHDNKGVMDDHLTLGEGEIPWKGAVQALVADGYRGTFVIESRDFASGEASLGVLGPHLRRAG